MRGAVHAVRLLAFALLASCAVGPSYHRPAVHAPAEFASPLAPGPAGTVVDSAAWWRALKDPELDSLMGRAVVANPTVGIALAHLQEARAFEAGVIGRALPIAEASAGAGHGTGSDVTRGRAAPGLVSADSSRGLTQINELGGFDAAWELDVFGKYRREMQAAHFDSEAAAAARDAALVSVLADVARAYVDLRGLQTQSVVLHSAIKALEEAKRITAIRFERGITNELDAVLAARELARLQASVAPVDASVGAAQYALAVLLGEYPEAMVVELSAPGLVPAIPAGVDAGAPVDLLRRRPDVRQAEWELAGASAGIGVAIARLLPTVAITGSIGYQRQGLGVTPGAGQHVWSVGPAALWPLLDFGALDAEVEIANLETHARLIAYRSTVQAAVRDVDTAIGGLAAERTRLLRLGEALLASQRAVTLANERYARGLTDYLNVVDAEREEYALEVEYASAQVALAEQFIALYKALGGGWQHYEDLPPAYWPKPAVVAMFERLLGRNDQLK
jgi:NodT family efflux transporter outer membrane factor (OMF) lipoprotein